jgi:hypothetical protein
MAISKRGVLIGAAASALLGVRDGKAAKTRSGPPVYTLVNGDAVMSLLESAPYVSFGSGAAIIYELSFRACGPCIAFTRSGARDLIRAGFQVSSFVFAPKPSGRRNFLAGPGEMASVAEIYRTRSADYYDAWFRSNMIDGFAVARGVADITNNVAANAAVTEGRAKIKALATLFEQSSVGTSWGFPGFIWRDQNGVHAKFGYNGARDLLDAIRRR